MRRPARVPTILAAAAALSVALAASSAAEHRGDRGSIRHSGDRQRREYRIYYEDRDRIRMQREAISAQDEARREPGRERRRDEIAEEMEQAERDFLASQESMRNASRASIGAPRGSYYRRPGSTTSELPAGHSILELEKGRYGYYSGIFFRETPGGHVAVTAPAGATVESLPGGAMEIPHQQGAGYHYYFGTFFTESGEGFTVVAPPDGIVVPYLPDGYATERVDGGTRYTFGGVRYRPFYREGVLVYSTDGRSL